MLHIYYGEGKGKTTASAGLAIRAMGQGRKVVFAQFMKAGTAGEMTFFRDGSIKNIKLITPDIFYGFYRDMTQAQKDEMKEEYSRMLEMISKVLDENEGESLLVLDEILHAVYRGLADEKHVIELINKHVDKIEIVLTGRNPSETILDMADYVTYFEKIKHPFDSGIKARKGIEF